jgi:hypothetical protein
VSDEEAESRRYDERQFALILRRAAEPARAGRRIRPGVADAHHRRDADGDGPAGIRARSDGWVAAIPISGGAGRLTARLLWGRVVRKWQTRMDQLLDRIGEVSGQR